MTLPLSKVNGWSEAGPGLRALLLKPWKFMRQMILVVRKGEK